MIVFVAPDGAHAKAEACEEAAAEAISKYLVKEEPKANFEIVRYPDGSIRSLIDRSDIYAELDFSAVYEDHDSDPKVRIYEFRDNSYIVFATLIEQDASGKVVCQILDVDSGQDDQD